MSITFSSLSSCSKESQVLPEKAKLTKVCDKRSALEDFSIALSKAVYSHQELRAFLKAEALKRFDNDDDVFYPLVKDKSVGNLGTLRELLIRELGSDEMMSQIEQELRTLTIYVADATWFDPDGFCLDAWDTENPCVAITYIEDDGLCRKLYGNGFSLGEIEDGTIPGGPVLIVKESERIIASSSTKADETGFSFLSDVFDASKNDPETKGRYTVEYLNEPQGDSSPIMSASALNSINPDIIQAYNLFKNNSYACHNDYVFYGMTSNSTTGRLRTDVRNKLYRFKVHPQTYLRIFDDKVGNEAKYVNSWAFDDNYKGYGMMPSKEKVYNKLWADGLLEIKVAMHAGGGNEMDAYFSVKARDLFTVKDNVVRKKQWKATLIHWVIEWKYDYTKARGEESLNSKWYYPNYDVFLPSWDLRALSSYEVQVSEIDSGAVTREDMTITTKHASQFSEKISFEYTSPGDTTGKSTLKNELGWSSSDEVTKNHTVSVTWTNGDDYLGRITISYADKIIKGVQGSEYELYTYSSGDFTFNMLPFRY